MSDQTGTPTPAQPGDAAPTAPSEAQPQKAPSLLKRILFAVIGLVVVAGIGLVVRTIIAEASGDLSTAEVGDCVDDQPDINDVRVVDCGSEEAAFEVVSVNEGFTRSEFDQAPFEELCPSATDPTSKAIWYGEEGSDGDVYCVNPVSS